MNTLTAPEESDSRTSSVGRKRASHQLTEDLDGPVSSMDSSDDQSSKRSRKRARPNDSPDAEGDAVPSQVQVPINNGVEVKQETSGDRPEAALPAAISWNKGIQATVRTSFGRSPALTKMVSDNKPSAAQQVDDGPANEADSHISGDASTSTSAEAPRKRAKRTKSKSQKGAQAALDVATNKAVKDQGANILDESNDKSNLQTPLDSSVGYVKGIRYTLPTPCERREKEKSSPFVRRDLLENFVPRFFVCNGNVLKNIDQSVVVSACEAYVKENYSDEDEKSATAVMKSGFKGYCKNRLKEAIQAGKGQLSKSKSNSSASSVNGSNGKKDMDEASSKKSSTSLSVGQEGQTSAIPGPAKSNQFSNSPLNEGENQDAKEEITLPSQLLGKRRRDSTEASAQESAPTEIAAQTISQSADHNSRAESAGSALSERAPEQVDEVIKVAEDLETDHQKSLPSPSERILEEAELLLIRRYYPSLPLAIRCLTCGDDGHMAASCPRLTCAVCGVRGVHFESSCPKNIRCTKCRQQGHQKSDCPEKLALAPSEGAACDKCGSSRHTEQSCHFLWRSFMPDAEPIRKVQNILVDCYNCGADGHFGPECALHRSALLTGGYTWSIANRNRYVDSETSSRAISAGKDYRIPPKSKKGFSIKGSAKNNPVKLDDSDEDEGFIRPKIVPPPSRNHIHFADRQPANRNAPQAPRYPPPPSIQNSYPSHDDDRFRRERQFSPPPRYPDYQQRRGDEQYHNFDRDNGYRPQGRPLSPFRANTNGRQVDDYVNVAPPQSLAGKKNGRGPRPRGAGNRGGAGRGGANRGRK